MHISFYAPLKPLSHPHPSGDLVIGTGLFEFLKKSGHRLTVASALRARWIYWKPWRWLNLLVARKQAAERARRSTADIWLTYHAYYKAPDLLGPSIAARLHIPYVIFQGAYATKRRKKLRTRPGYLLNKKSLRAANHVFTNKRVDLHNLGRLLPPQRISYVAPGIVLEDFPFDPQARSTLRQEWNVDTEPVVVSAAMFRPGIKADGLSCVIRACGRLHRNGRPLHLAIAGDGKERNRLRALADAHLPGKVTFVGKIPRKDMYRFYSAGDIFAFPGIRESLGMVYLEAQSCGRPVVAFQNGGIPEVVRDGETGLLVPMHDLDRFTSAIETLLTQEHLRRQMGARAQAHVHENHDLEANYAAVENILEKIVRDHADGRLQKK